MKNLMIIFGLILSMISNSIAATGSGNVSQVTQLGGVSSSDNIFIPNSNPDGYFTLVAAFGAATSGLVYRLIKNGTAYQVTVGKTFKISKICISATTANSTASIVTSTVAFAEGATYASLTSASTMAGTAGNYPIQSSPTSNVYQCYNYTYDIPASSYVGFQAGASVSYNIFVIGKEI